MPGRKLTSKTSSDDRGLVFKPTIHLVSGSHGSPVESIARCTRLAPSVKNNDVYISASIR